MAPPTAARNTAAQRGNDGLDDGAGREYRPHHRHHKHGGPTCQQPPERAPERALFGPGLDPGTHARVVDAEHIVARCMNTAKNGEHIQRDTLVAQLLDGMLGLGFVVIDRDQNDLFGYVN